MRGSEKAQRFALTVLFSEHKRQPLRHVGGKHTGLGKLLGGNVRSRTMDKDSQSGRVNSGKSLSSERSYYARKNVSASSSAQTGVFSRMACNFRFDD